MNNDLCTYLLYIGRKNRALADLLGPWIPKIRTFATKITDVHQLENFPEPMLIETALKEIAQNPISNYEPVTRKLTEKELEFQQLAKTLPKDLRLRIFGYAIKCHSCSKRMHNFTEKDLSQPWLLINNKNFCSRVCVTRYQSTGGAGRSTIVDNLTASCGILSNECARLAIC